MYGSVSVIAESLFQAGVRMPWPEEGNWGLRAISHGYTDSLQVISGRLKSTCWSALCSPPESTAREEQVSSTNQTQTERQLRVPILSLLHGPVPSGIPLLTPSTPRRFNHGFQRTLDSTPLRRRLPSIYRLGNTPHPKPLNQPRSLMAWLVSPYLMTQVNRDSCSG